MTAKEQVKELENIIDRHSVSFILATDVYNAGYRKIIWHKVSENDLPTRQGQKVWLCTSSKDYFIANYWDDTEVGGKQFFEIASAGRITLSNVLAWVELPKYEEKDKMTFRDWLKTGTIIASDKNSATYWWLRWLFSNEDKGKCIKKFQKCLRRNQP